MKHTFPMTPEARLYSPLNATASDRPWLPRLPEAEFPTWLRNHARARA